MFLTHQDLLVMKAVARMKKKVEQREEAKRKGILPALNTDTAIMTIRSLPHKIYHAIMESLAEVFKISAQINRLLERRLPGHAVLVKQLAEAMLPMFFYILVGALIGGIEGWTFAQSMYFAAMTVTTIGSVPIRC